MKIRSLAPLAVACLALFMPRLVTSGDAFGGAIEPGPTTPCTHKDKPHQCSEATDCGSIPTTDVTDNNAEKTALPGTADPGTCSNGMNNCTGSARPPKTDCVPPA